MVRQYSLYALLALYAVMMFGLVVAHVRDGYPFRAVASVLLAAPVLLAVLATSLERRAFGPLVDLRKGAWSFLIGDTFVLTTAAAIAALAWQDLPQSGWAISWWWTVLSAVVGAMAGTAFHVMDSPNYVNKGAAEALLSPTKLAHDFVAYPVLFGGLLCVGVPLLFHRSWHTWALVGCVIVWLALCVADGRRTFNPLDLHPRWDPRTFVSVKQ